MKRWRGEPDHPHWKSLIKPRDKAWAALAFFALSIFMTAWSVTMSRGLCADGGRLLCRMVGWLSTATGAPLHLAEAMAWSVLGLLALVHGWSLWRQR